MYKLSMVYKLLDFHRFSWYKQKKIRASRLHPAQGSSGCKLQPKEASVELNTKKVALKISTRHGLQWFRQKWCVQSHHCDLRWSQMVVADSRTAWHFQPNHRFHKHSSSHGEVTSPLLSLHFCQSIQQDWAHWQGHLFYCHSDRKGMTRKVVPFL